MKRLQYGLAALLFIAATPANACDTIDNHITIAMSDTIPTDVADNAIIARVDMRGSADNRLDGAIVAVPVIEMVRGPDIDEISLLVGPRTSCHFSSSVAGIGYITATPFGQGGERQLYRPTMARMGVLR